MSKANSVEGLGLESTAEDIDITTHSRKAFLLTLYTPRNGKNLVLVQASHDSSCFQFSDLESATSHIAKASCFSANKEDI